MSTRYVWEKWNIIEDWIYKGSGNYGDGTSVVKAENFYGSISQACYYGNSVSYNGSQTILSGNVGRVTVSSTSSRDSESEIPAGKYVQSREINNEKIVYKSKDGSTYYQGRIYALPSYDDYDYGADLEFRNVDRYSFEKGKGSTSYGDISSASSGAYPSSNYSGSYWYVKKGSDTIDPASVTYPASPNGGELVDITIAPSTGNTFGGTVKYKVEYQLNGGSWQTAVESTTSTTVSVLIPKGTQTFAARATASDDTGFTSTTAVTGATVNVVNNAAPVINCETSSLGEIAEPFSVSYSVSDEDGDTMTITEKIDGTVIRSYSASSGSSGEQTFSPDAMQWLTTLNGSHTATITADDGKGGVTTHSISFTRAVHTMTVTLEEPMETDAAITKCVVNIARNLPADAEWSLLVTNNAFDPEPVWEDITQYVKNGWNWVFENQTVTSGRYGFNFKLTCTRGASGQGGYVDTISGGFE